MILRPKHPRAGQNGYVREHILVMEAYLKRPLTLTENVHHINHNRADNRIENLKLFESFSRHMAEHYGTDKLGPQICSINSSHKAAKKGKGNGYRWYINKEKTGWICNNCYNHQRHKDGATTAKFVN